MWLAWKKERCITAPTETGNFNVRSHFTVIKVPGGHEDAYLAVDKIGSNPVTANERSGETFLDQRFWHKPSVIWLARAVPDRRVTNNNTLPFGNEKRDKMLNFGGSDVWIVLISERIETMISKRFMRGLCGRQNFWEGTRFATEVCIVVRCNFSFDGKTVQPVLFSII